MSDESKEELIAEEIKNLPVAHIPEVIRIKPETLNIFRRLFADIQEKQKELEELKAKLDIAILISLTTKGIPESEFLNWKTNLDEGYHVKLATEK
jgi:hypothetical protein